MCCWTPFNHFSPPTPYNLRPGAHRFGNTLIWCLARRTMKYLKAESTPESYLYLQLPHTQEAIEEEIVNKLTHSETIKYIF